MNDELKFYPVKYKNTWSLLSDGEMIVMKTVGVHELSITDCGTSHSLVSSRIKSGGYVVAIYEVYIDWQKW